MSRLPLVDLKHCDVSAILLEIQSLRQEVGKVGELQLERSRIKQQLAEAINLKEQMTDYKKFFMTQILMNSAALVRSGSALEQNPEVVL